MATSLEGGVVYDYMMDGDGDPELLFEPLIQLFWKLHGDRATIVNWALVMGYGKETREFLGRWSPSASDEYIRVQKFVCMKTQEEIGRRIRKGDLKDTGFLGEIDTWEELRSWAERKQIPPPVVDRQIRKLRAACTEAHQRSSSVRESDFSELEEPSPTEDDEGFITVQAAGLSSYMAVGDVDKLSLQVLDPVELPPLDTDTETEEANPAGIASGTFIVSHRAGGKARTLHRIGRCWRKPGQHYKSFTVLESLHCIEDVSLGAFGKICKDCYPLASSSSQDPGTVSPKPFDFGESSSSSSSSSDSD